MKPIPLFWANIQKGELRWHDIVRLKEYLRSFQDGQELEIQIRKFKKNRTLSQNSYWHGVVLPIIADSIGELDSEELCQIFRKKFLSYRKHYKGKEYIFTESTAKLSTAEMGMFVDRVIMFVSSEFGIIIPPPNKVAL